MQNSHSSLEEINAVLTRFGRILYQSGRPLQHYSETINAVVAERPHLRRSMQSAWNLAFGWNQAEPSAHHLAMPFQVLLASCRCAFTGDGISSQDAWLLGGDVF